MKRKKQRKMNKVLLLVAGVLLMSQNGWAAPLFEAGESFDAGNTPWSVAVGDINGDGAQDLAVANQTSHSVSILLGNGDGTYQAATNYDVESTPTDIVMGDLDGDGKLDLAVANMATGSISVLVGKGDGLFEEPVHIHSVGWNTYSLAIGDLDGDLDLDLAVSLANGEDDAAVVLLGNGDGTFQPPVSYPVGSYAGSIAMGDLDGDGIQDLVTANYGGGTISILTGNGDGTFQAAVNISAAGLPYSVAVGDLDGDLDLDLAVANLVGDNVSVLLNNGDGTFLAAVYYSVGDSPRCVKVGDLDGDGVLDLAVANLADANASILLGNGDGTFLTEGSYSVGGAFNSLSMGYLDGDGALDLVVTTYGSDTVSVLINTSAPNLDKDFDGVLDSVDNCLAWGNPLQKDMDGDGIGNLCEPGDGKTDTDGDGIHDAIDNCVNVPNPLQTDLDHDNIGFVCEPGPDLPDTDGDHIADSKDNCPSDPNPRQKDLDKDGVGTVCDADESSYALYSRMLWAENREMSIINKKTSIEATYMTAYERAIFFETFTFESMIRQRNGDEARMNCVCHTTKWESKWGNPKRAIIGPDADFPGVVQDGWNHVDGPVENIDCLACHYIGDHKSGVVKLVDSDAAGDVIYEYDPDDPSSIDPFCWSCHDSDGWTSGFQRTPFSDRVVVPDQYNNHYGNECTSCHSSSSGSFNGHALFFGG